MLLFGPANAISGSLYPNLPFNFLRDIVPVAGVTREALVMVVHPSVPAKTVAEFLALGESQSRNDKMASTGDGGSPHVTGELFKQMDGLASTSCITAAAGPALKAMIEGQAQMMFEPMSASIGPVRSGKLRALAVTTGERSRGAAGRAAVRAVPGYEASAVTGIGVPKGTPAAVIETLNKAVQAAFTDPAMQAKLADTGGAPLPGTRGRVRRADGGRNREVGQGGEGGRHQGGVSALPLAFADPIMREVNLRLIC